MDRDALLDQLRELNTLLNEHRALQVLLIIVLSLVAAKLVDLILTRVIMRLTRKTATEIDDIIVSMLHRPIFNTVLLAGAIDCLLGSRDSLFHPEWRLCCHRDPDSPAVAHIRRAVWLLWSSTG